MNSGILPNVRQAHLRIWEIFYKAEKPTHVSTVRERAILFLVIKALRTQRAMEALSERGLGQDAMTLLRSLYETMITQRYLAEKASAEEIDRYAGFVHISKEKHMDTAFTAFPASPRAAQMREREAEIREQATLARERLFSGKNPNDWGPSFAVMARSLDIEPTHRFLYGYLSDFAHPEAVVADQYATQDEHALYPRIEEPDYDATNAAFGTAAGLLREVLECFNKTFHCGIEETELDEIHRLLKAKEPATSTETRRTTPRETR